MHTKRYNRVQAAHYFRHRDIIRTATVYNLRAFADSVGGDLRTFRHVISTGVGRGVRTVQFHKDWGYVTQEEVEGERDAGGHQYVVYGKWQDEPPTEEQLANPPARPKNSPKKTRAQRRLFAQDPNGVVYVIYGLPHFCASYDINPNVMSDVFLGRQKTFRERTATVPAYEFTPSVFSRVNSKTRRLEWRGRHISRSRGLPRWQTITLPDLLPALKAGTFRTIVLGFPFEGWPDPDWLETEGVTLEDVFSSAVLDLSRKYFELHGETSDRVE